METTNYIKEHIEELYDIGYALSAEKNFNALIEKILTGAKKISGADAGTIYLLNKETQSLEFTIVQTDSLRFKIGGTKDEQVQWPSLPLYYDDGTPNDINVSVVSALEDRLINIEDVYKAKEFKFDGARAFDTATGYRTQSMLLVPMKNHENDVIGVLQLINKTSPDDDIIKFTQDDEKLILSMASQAAVIITNRILIQDMEKLLNAFIKSIATAIGEKSKYTVGHINRVAEISLLIANAVNDDKDGIYKDKNYTEDELKEIDIAAWMHDIGKITTPEYVVDKARKLETIHDRIESVKYKFELLKTQLELDYLKNRITKDDFESKIKELDKDFAFIEKTNVGSEFLVDEAVERIHQIALNKVYIDGHEQNLLSENEVENLCIRKGTLTDDERFVINNHALMSIKMLDSLPFPKKLKRVPEIAGGHHEKIVGGGYPYGLKGDEISFEARILAIADIFEALTAHDRPYKQANSLNQSMRILKFMVDDGTLDGDIVKFFVDKKLHLQYAEDNLSPDQMDEVTIEF